MGRKTFVQGLKVGTTIKMKRKKRRTKNFQKVSNNIESPCKPKNTVSQKTSNLLPGNPKPQEAILRSSFSRLLRFLRSSPHLFIADGTGGDFWFEDCCGACGGGGRLEGMNGEDDTELKLEEDWGPAGRMVARLDWTLAWMRFSIPSMSDCDKGWRGIVSLFDIF